MSQQLASDIYKTTDLALASALITSGLSLLSIDRVNPKKVEFVFAFNDEASKLVNRFWNDDLHINARTYFDSIKMLKSRLYSER